MPIETIRCRECGSADVTEFNPHSYVCRHCEAVFKHVPEPGVSTGPVFCSQACGMLAVAQCVQCMTPLCADHALRWRDGVLCPAHSNERREAAAQAESVALAAATARLKQAIRRFAGEIGNRAPELWLRHRLVDRDQIKGLRIGDPCPVHGPCCTAVDVSTTGRFNPKVTKVEMDMGAWVLRHKCPYSHHDLHSGSPYRPGSLVDLVVISRKGEINYSVGVYGLPLPDRSTQSHHAYSADRDDFSLVAHHVMHWKPVKGNGSAIIDDLADRIEQILSGGGQLGDEPCR